MTQPHDASGDAAWARYLDAVENRTRKLDEQITGGTAAGPVDARGLGELTPPPGPLPARMAPRRARLLTLLTDVTARATARRDALWAELTAMPRRRAAARHDSAASLGGNLDVKG